MANTIFEFMNSTYDLACATCSADLMVSIEESDEVNACQLYSMMCFADHKPDNEDDWLLFMHNIRNKYPMFVPDNSEVICDDAIVKTILNNYSQAFDAYLRSDQKVAVMKKGLITNSCSCCHDKIFFTDDEKEHQFITLSGTASIADEQKHKPIQQVRVVHSKPLLVTKHLNPVEVNGVTLGSVGKYSVIAYQHSFALSPHNPNASFTLTPEIYAIAKGMFDDYQGGVE